MAAEGAHGGVAVTSGPFTQEAQAFAAGKNLKLIDGPQLMKLLTSVRDSSPQVQRKTPRLDNPHIGTAPNCPRCGATTVKRLAKKGALAGKEFWGCSRFPSCRGTVA